MSYDNIDVCVCCGCKNKVTVTSHLELRIIIEAVTECENCGYIGDWHSGHFVIDEYEYAEIEKIRRQINQI